MPGIVYSTGPIEQEFGVNQLRLKVLNNSASTATVYVTVFRLDGTKSIFFNENLTLSPSASTFLFVDSADLSEFEVEFFVSSPDVLVAVFAVNTIQRTFSAASSVRHSEMVNTSSGH